MEKDYRPTSRPINETHAIISRWRTEVIPPEHLTPQGEYNRSLEEVRELKEELEVYDGSPESGKRVGLEAIDVMIRMMGVIDALGFDTESLMAEKLDQMYRKYNPHMTGKLMTAGFTWQDAMRMQKAHFTKHNSHDTIVQSNGNNGHLER